jgi:hypothetical protein
MTKTRTIAALALLLVAAAPAAGQERAPNRLDVVERVTAEDPARFACAHAEDRGCRYDWIKAVAAALHATDSRWGLNGKRGNANDLSMDVVTWRLGPTDRHVQAFDICGACGAASARPVWSDITNWSTVGQSGTAVWVKPEGVATQPATGGTVTPPPPPPDGTVVAKLNELIGHVAALTATVEGLRQQSAAAAAQITLLTNERLTEDWAARVWAATDPEKPAAELPPFPTYRGCARLLGCVTLSPQ